MLIHNAIILLFIVITRTFSWLENIIQECGTVPGLVREMADYFETGHQGSFRPVFPFDTGLTTRVRPIMSSNGHRLTQFVLGQNLILVIFSNELPLLCFSVVNRTVATPEELLQSSSEPTTQMNLVSLNKIQVKLSKKYYGGIPRLVDIIPDKYKKALMPKLKARPIHMDSGVRHGFRKAKELLTVSRS